MPLPPMPLTMVTPRAGSAMKVGLVGVFGVDAVPALGDVQGWSGEEGLEVVEN